MDNLFQFWFNFERMKDKRNKFYSLYKIWKFSNLEYPKSNYNLTQIETCYLFHLGKSRGVSSQKRLF